MRVIRLFTLLILGLVVFSSEIDAATILVTNTNDSGPGSLREMVAYAAPGDTIEFDLPDCPCTITLTSGEIVIDKPFVPNQPLNIGSSADPTDITISGNNTSRIFRILDGYIQIFRLTLTNGNVPDGGGAISNQGYLSLHLSNVANNRTTGRGAGIYNGTGGSLNIFVSSITGNSAVRNPGFGGTSGGGIFNDGGSIFLSDTTLSGNTSTSGAGIYNYIGTVDILRTTVSGNTAGDTLDDGTFQIGVGGGIYISTDGTTNITNSTISGNTAITLDNPSYGGGIINGGTLNVINTTLTGNVATNTGNTPNSQGGGIFNSLDITGNPVPARVKNAIIAGNSAQIGSDVAGIFESQGYNLIGIEDGGIGFGDSTSQRGSIASPLNPLLGFLQNDGGATSTHALLPGSPAIDKGAAAFDPITNSPITTDQRSAVTSNRPVDDPNIPDASGGNGSDVGAFELQLVSQDSDGDGITDAIDNCPATPNPNQGNNDGDAEGDACDADDDNDDQPDTIDNCPFNFNPSQTDADTDGLGNACDPDDDNDGRLDGFDNCPLNANPDQANADGDALGDVCDPDDDNDGVLDGSDNCPLNANPTQADNDNDGQGDACDADDDNDNIPDAGDNCPLNFNPSQQDTDGDGQGNACDADDDNDGRVDIFDNCPLNANPNQGNNDGDSQGDVCDTDDDNDGVLDVSDNCPFVANPTQTDTDNDGIGDACDATPNPVIKAAYGVPLRPSNGGLAIFGVVNNGGTLTGALTYARGTTFYFATRVTSFVISGQTATIEGFSSSGQLFIARMRDGGAGQPDNFRLWIEGVEQTAPSGALTSGNLIINPWGPDTRLNGWVDLHTHPMSNLAFGGKLFHGAPSVGSLMPAVQMPNDPECRFDNRATSIGEALSQDGPTRGDPIQSRCGDFIRRGLINAIESNIGDANVAPIGSGGYPDFTHWPRWNDVTHQKMWIDWIRRSWQGGQRVMVALSHNNRTLAELLGGGGPISGVRNDKASSDLQIEEIETLVAANSDFMAVARTPAELHNIVQGGRLAVVLGVEIDKIGDFDTNAPPSTQAIDTEIDRLFAQGVRYILPIHLTDNAFGDTAIYEPLFNIVNYRENSSFWTVGCAAEADEIGFRSVNFPSILNPFIPPGMPSPPTAPDCLIQKPAGPFFTGHVNARTANGLTSVGEYTLRALMRRGIIIDIDHMSNRAANRTLTIAGGIAGGGYPVMSGHSGIRNRMFFQPGNERHAENSRTTTQLARIACLGGMFGLGTDGARAVDWTFEYARGYDIMRRAFAPNGLCPTADPLGGTSFLALGTDTNSLGLTPRPTMVDTTTPRFTDIYNPSNPINQGVPPLIRSTEGTRTWDYNTDGVAHYGMFLDFLRDVRTLSASVTMNGRQIVDDQMMFGAERFYQMWRKSDAQKVRVP